MSNITFIRTAEIYPHPDNPRRDVGDVTELADSIRAMGVLQNLTVVPGHRTNKSGRADDGYTVIIGHRRLAAAKKAGLETVPCVIAEMDEKEQLATMLLENMQRADLTIPEQAFGMQMMMNLGSSADEIAEKTGLSGSTVQRRLKVATLPEKEALAAQASLTLDDYIKIAGLRDPKEQKKVLNAAGTANFGWTMSAAISAQNIKDGLKILKARMKELRIPQYDGKDGSPQYSSKYERVASCAIDSCTKDASALNVPKHTSELQWFSDGRWFHLIKKRKETKNEKSAAEKKADKTRQALRDWGEQAYKSRLAFVTAFHREHTYAAELHDELVKAVCRRAGCGCDYDLLWKVSEGEARPYYRPASADLIDGIREKGEKIALLIYALYSDTKSSLPVEMGYGDDMPKHKPREPYSQVYEFLARIGYEISDEEQMMLDGNHPLLVGGAD